MGCSLQRWSGPTDVYRSYTCAYSGGHASCDCDGTKREVAFHPPADAGVRQVCPQMVSDICKVPPRTNFCQEGDNACWGELGDFQCLCSGSQTLVPSTGDADCYSHLQNVCNLD